MIKPLITADELELVFNVLLSTSLEEGDETDKLLTKIDDLCDNSFVPLYAIPEGYHIVAIDPEQELRDNLERHNEKVRGNNHYQAGYLGLPLGSNLNEDQATEYHQGAKDRQREREA